MRADDPRWGCAHPNCDAHPANPNNGGPIYRTSPKGQPWEGLCGKHLAADVADSTRPT